MRALPSRRSVLAGGSALIAAGIAPASVAAQTAGTPTLYYSDYYSFAGRDEKGAVYLAHDSNRGRTGDAFQADHWIAMYDDATGWVDVKGSAPYPNPDKVLDRIPPSPHFTATGTPTTGPTLDSRTNDMRLVVDPLPRTLNRENQDGIFWVGGAPATLTWAGREIKGRVLFEYLQRHNWNRFTADFGRNWNNFNGLYLLTDSGHDFYAHFHEREGGSDLNGKLVGLASWGTPAPVSDLAFEIRDSASVPYRRYRWPAVWRVGFSHEGVRYVLDVSTMERRLFADWETGGFAMSVVAGRISRDDGTGTTLRVIGWAELLI